MDSQPKGVTQSGDVNIKTTVTAEQVYSQSLAAVKRRLNEDCHAKASVLQPVGHPVQPPLQNGGAPVAVDLVVLVDTSDSMADEVNRDGGLCAIAASTIQSAVAACRTDLRVIWLGIEGTWPNTKVAQSARAYLTSIGTDATQISGRRRDTVKNQGAQEDGARAVTDIAHYFDWRLGAVRLILFLGDEALEGGNPADTADHKATEEAIRVANNEKVKVFAYVGTGQDRIGVDAPSYFQYLRITRATGGSLYAAPRENLRRFRSDLTQIICPPPDAGSGTVSLPRVHPCFELYWGDGPQDQIETSDLEMLCIKACNLYTNVIFHDLTIARLTFTRANGEALPKLPDGTAPIMLTPSRMIEFGELDCHRPQLATANSSQMRELTLISKGAAHGEYLLNFACRYWAEIVLEESDTFTLQLVAS